MRVEFESSKRTDAAVLMRGTNHCIDTWKDASLTISGVDFTLKFVQ